MGSASERRPNPVSGAVGPLGPLTFVLLLAANYLVFIYAPVERVMGPVQKVFYFHVGAAWNAFLAFAVVFVACIAYLKTRERKWDVLAASSAEIGVVFTTIVLVTGPLWARPVWNTWWTWDPRLTTTLVLWFLYVGYLLIRAMAQTSERKATLAAVFGIVAFIDVPIVFMSIRWWRTIHPVVIETTSMNMDSAMAVALVVSVAAFTSLYAFMLEKRQRVERIKDEVEKLKAEIEPH